MGWVEDKKAHTIAVVYNFMPEPDSKYEPFKIDSENWVFRFANRSRCNNVMIKFNPNDVKY